MVRVREEKNSENKWAQQDWRSHGEKIQPREQVGKPRNTLFFLLVCGSGGSKSMLAKAAGAEPSGQMRNEKRTPLRHEGNFQVKMYKTQHVRSTFGSIGSWDVEKVCTAVAWSTFPSQNVQGTPCSHHFGKLRCWKGARRCGAKQISESKVWKTDRFRVHFWC